MDMPFGIKDKGTYNDFLIHLKKCLSYPSGRKVLLKILGECNIYEVSNVFSNNIEAFKSGQRNIGVQILNAVMDVDGGRLYTDMLKEYWKTYHEDTVLDNRGS